MPETAIFREVLHSIKVMIELIAKEQLSHAERRRQLELLTNYVNAQSERFKPKPSKSKPSIQELLKEAVDDYMNYMENWDRDDHHEAEYLAELAEQEVSAPPNVGDWWYMPDDDDDGIDEGEIPF